MSHDERKCRKMQENNGKLRKIRERQNLGFSRKPTLARSSETPFKPKSRADAIQCNIWLVKTEDPVESNTLRWHRRKLGSVMARDYK